MNNIKDSLITNLVKFKWILILVSVIFFSIIFVISYIIYKIKQNNKVSSYCNIPTSSKEYQVFSSKNMKPSYGVYQLSFHFFIYINDFNYRYGKLKEVFSKGDADYACPSFSLDKNVNNGIINIMTSKGLQSVILPNIDINRWCHIAICIKNSEVDLYYRGKLVKTEILKGFCKINGESLFIGKNGGFNGLIYKLTYNPAYLMAKDVYKLAKVSPPTSKTYFKQLE